MGTVLSTEYMTLADWATVFEPDGTLKEIVEIMNESNNLIGQVPWREANGVFGHRLTVRSALPAVSFRRFNRGIIATKSARKEETVEIAHLTGLSLVDKDKVDRYGPADARAKYRAQEDAAFIEAETQKAVTTFLYGNSAVNPDEFTGLSAKFGSLSGSTAGQIVNAGGFGSDNTSIWLVHWHPNDVYGVFPRGGRAGLDTEDLGIQLVADTANGGYIPLYATKFDWTLGLAVADYRQVAVARNIDVSDLSADISTGADLIDTCLQLIHKINQQGRGRPTFLMHRDTLAMLNRQAVNKSATDRVRQVRGENGVLRTEVFGIPVVTLDRMSKTEAAIS